MTHVINPPNPASLKMLLNLLNFGRVRVPQTLLFPYLNEMALPSQKTGEANKKYQSPSIATLASEALGQIADKTKETE